MKHHQLNPTRRLITAAAAVTAALSASGCMSATYTNESYQPSTTGVHSETPWWDEVSMEAPETLSRSAHLCLPAAVLFAHDSATISTQGRDQLVALVAQHHLTDADAITVAGATDPTGTAAYNLDLSLRRANAAAEVLIELGIDANLIRTEGWGDTRPVPTPPDTDTATAHAMQRRIEILAHFTTVSGTSVQTVSLLSTRSTPPTPEGAPCHG